ncbi:sensor histidine kinase [Gordonia sp. TBRC 11910]|uniref:histidine kinase n=1 Tax=Gordonia asplenii TaxID=2725283 RepID=A0A848KT13_9ACTN|nr:sensor histidine kinase [Gordonia asplenii]NMN99642.1 sensor histidine kinase [Gordonia asplenii]
MRRLVPTSLAGQAMALAVLVVAVLVIAAGVLATLDARADGQRAAREEVGAVAASIAAAPSTAQALSTSNPTSVLQPMTERIRAQTQVAFITIMNRDGIRFTHTNPALIGQRYLGTIDAPLRGETFTETYRGTLGPSIRTVVPIRDARGSIVGLVSVGITTDSLARSWESQIPLIAGLGAAALCCALGGLWLLRRRISRDTGGLAPQELRRMYEHHDAVLRSVREGLVVVEGGRPVLFNDEARRLLESDADDPPDFLTGADPIEDRLYVDGARVLVVNRMPVATRRDSAVVTIRDRTELSSTIGELDSMTRFAEALRSQAHESANRLHTIITLVEMGRADDAVALATDSLDLSQQLIDQLAESVAEPALVALLLGKVAQAGERGIELRLTEDSQLSDTATQLLSTPELITVIGNLVDNALDAADPEDPWVELTIIGDDGRLEVVVADSGAGMDPAMFARAQQRGYSTKSGGDEAGRGIGLALVARVVRRHAGAIVAESTYGSVVRVRIDAAGHVSTTSSGRSEK